MREILIPRRPLRWVRVTALVALGPVLPGRAEIDPQDVRLDPVWSMQTGDETRWADPATDPGGSPTPVGVPWEEAGFPDLNGFAWYRTRVVVPATWRTAPAVQAHGGTLILHLGFIDDVDVTYWNGVEIGRSGSFPPAYRTAYDQERIYTLPGQLVRWGEPNVLAVRVYDGEGPGGLYDGPYRIRPTVPPDFFDLAVTPETPDGIFSAAAPIRVTVRIRSREDHPTDTVLDITFTDDRVRNPSALDRRTVAVPVPANGWAERSVEFAPPNPGFYRLACTLADKDNSALGQRTLVVGSDPEGINPPLTRAPDFNDFWRERLRELADVPPAYRLIPDPRSSDERTVHEVEMRSHSGVRVRGWYTVPNGPGPYPAILRVPGYGGALDAMLDRSDAAVFALNPRGHGTSRQDLDPGNQEYMFLHVDPAHPEAYVYVGAYLDCVRAVDFLASRPEIDATRIAVEGNSQGGGLTFATAALDPRIACAAPGIPWMGDWLGYRESDEWPHEHYPKLQAQVPGLSLVDFHRILGYVDTMNLADRIRCPVLMAVGLQDDVCPPRICFAPFNRIRSAKSYRVYPFLGHTTDERFETLKTRWLNQQLGLAASEKALDHE